MIRLQSAYLHCLLRSHQPSRTLRSASQHLLLIPLLNTNFGWHSCSYATAETWNNLPDTVKTHLPSLHLELALDPTCLTSSRNIRQTAFSPSGYCPRPRFDFFNHACIISSRIIIILLLLLLLGLYRIGVFDYSAEYDRGWWETVDGYASECHCRLCFLTVLFASASEATATRRFTNFILLLLLLSSGELSRKKVMPDEVSHNL